MIRYKVTNYGQSVTFKYLPKDWILTYKIGTTIKAPKGTPGIFTFDTYFQALNWTYGANAIASPSVRILLVRTKGRGKKPKKLFNLHHLSHMGNLTKFLGEEGYWSVPEGTRAYQEVYVLCEAKSLEGIEIRERLGR